jgi:hypothetical protein
VVPVRVFEGASRGLALEGEPARRVGGQRELPRFVVRQRELSGFGIGQGKLTGRALEAGLDLGWLLLLL